MPEEYIYERPDEPAMVVRDGWNVRIEWGFKQREEIVRCENCRFFDTRQCKSQWPLRLNGFCAWGERSRTE